MSTAAAPVPRRLAAHVASAVAALVVGTAVGCADGATTTPRRAESAVTGDFEATVSRVVPREDDRGLTFHLDLSGGDPGCRHSPRVQNVEETPASVHLDVVYTYVPEPAIGTAPCEPTTTALHHVLPSPVGARDLVVNKQAWTRDGDGYRRCDAILGCHPKPAGCDADSYRLAIRAGDFPAHGVGWEARGCDGTWLILDVDTGASGCPADAPASHSCRSERRVMRWILRNEGVTWSTVGTLPTSGGCGANPPRGLPRRLCASLGAA